MGRATPNPAGIVAAASIGSGAAGTSRIINDDSEVLTIMSPTIMEGDSGTQNLTFTVTSPKAVQGGFTLAFALSDVTTNAAEIGRASCRERSFTGGVGEALKITVVVNGGLVVGGN